MNAKLPSFVVILANDDEIDFVEAARILATPLDVAVADLVAQLAIAQGILVEGVSEGTAKHCAGCLLQNGIAVRVIPSEALIEPPPIFVLKSASLSDDKLKFATIPELGSVTEGSVDWSEILWLDCVSIKQMRQEEFEDWRVVSDETNRVVHFKNKRLREERPLQIDLVSYEPWSWLQIREGNFQFASTKVALQPTRRENLHHLAIVLGLRAKSAKLGPGMKWFSDHFPFRETRMINETVHHNHLSWQLTRLWLDSEEHSHPH